MTFMKFTAHIFLIVRCFKVPVMTSLFSKKLLLLVTITYAES